MNPTGELKDKSGNALASCIQNGGNDANGIITAICGDNVSTSGTLPWFPAVSYTSGDQIRCVSTGFWSVGAYDCTVTHSNGTFTGYHDPTNGTTAIRQHDSQGNILTDQSQSQSAVEQYVASGISSALSGLGSVAEQIISVVGSTILGFANLLLGIAGTLLNWVVIKTVFEFGNLIGNSPGLLIAWGLLRDIGNMVLLFGFIFMGIATILDLHTFSARRALPFLLIFAILMNFSLFAAEAVIDTSNALTSSIYAQTNTDPCVTSGTQTVSQGTLDTGDCGANYGIAGHIMQSTGLASMFKTSGSVAGTATTYIMLALFSTVGTVVLLAAAIMLVVRVVILSFIMISAPIGFAGMAIPPLRNLARTWWSKLFAEAFFAPVMFLLIFISLKVTDTFAGGTNESLAAAVQTPSSSVMGTIMIFSIVMGFLIASLVVARKMSASGATSAINFGTRFTYGGLARGTNFAFGGSAAAAKYFQQKYAPNSRVGKAVTQRVLTPLTTANLDMRRAPGMNKLLGVAGAGDAAKPSEHTSFKDIKHQYQDIRDNKKGQEREQNYQGELKMRRLQDNAHRGSLEDDDKKFLNTLSTKELEALHAIREGNSAIAQNLSPKQFENLMKSDKISDLEKGNIRTGRFSNIADLVKAKDAPGLKKALGGMNKKELENMPSTILMEPIVLDTLSDKQRDDLGGSEERSLDERNRIKASSKVERIKTDFATVGGAGIVSGSGSSGLKFSDLTREQVAKLSKEILTDPNVAKQFTPNVLMALQEEKGKFTPKDIQAIAAHITSLGSGPAYDYVNGKDSPGKIFWS